MILLTVIIIFTILFLVYYVSKKRFNYWKIRNIPYSKPLPVFGNYAPYILLKQYIGYVAQSICQEFPDKPYFGTFFGTEPALMIQDPEIIKQILTKDFYYFSGREISKFTHKELVTTNLFFTYGDRWKVLRQHLTPLFSSSKMKNMFYLIDKCAKQLESMLDHECGLNNVMKIKPLMTRYTMDCIGSCVFGVETKTMEKGSDKNPFTIIGHELFEESKYRGFKLITRRIWPAIFYGLGLRNFPVEIDKFFDNLMTKVFISRDYNPSSRNDFVDLLLNLKKEKYISGDSIDNIKENGIKRVSIEVTDELLTAQCALFFAAGFETSAATMHFMLYELAKNQEAQKRAAQEVDDFLRKHNNKITYECTTEMPYIEACMSETLRLYPVIGVLTREVSDQYTLPCGAVLDEGIRVHLPVYHMHHSPDHFPEPEEFRPERFLGNERRYIKPYTYFPFGEGPRICLGSRFAKMQIIPGVIAVLKKYQVELTKPPQKLEFYATTNVTQPKQMIQLKFVEREGWQDRLFS